MATELLELYELFEKKLGKEEAKKAIKLVEGVLRTIEEQAKAQKPILKAEIREELRNELVTKEEFFGEIGKLRQEMKTWLLFLGFLIVFLNKGTIEFALKVLGLLK